jgi:hypothetical protein
LPNGEKVKLQFTLTNHSPERLYVLTWYTPLEGIFGEIFWVARSGQPIPHEGPLVIRGDPLPENYILLEPGASVSAEVDLATAYDFSQAGEYTIEFLSPKISHAAKTEREFAMSVDDLGPVEISCNSLHLEIAGPSAPSTRRTRAEGAEMIRGYLRRTPLDLCLWVRPPSIADRHVHACLWARPDLRSRHRVLWRSEPGPGGQIDGTRPSLRAGRGDFDLAVTGLSGQPGHRSARRSGSAGPGPG